MSTTFDLDSTFFDQFLDDYYAECDEHLTVVRSGLLTLADHLGQMPLDQSLIDELFRRFHSIKGLSGMVGVEAAEQVAHQIESYLRALRQHQIDLTSEALDALIDGTKLLEQVIGAHRASSSPPDITLAMTRLENLLPSAKEVVQPAAAPTQQPSLPSTPPTSAPSEPAYKPMLSLNDETRDRLAKARQSGQQIWHFTFTPAAELAARDINVNTIRERLQEIGELLHAEPQLTSPDKIAFEFLVAGPPDATAFAGWDQDGLTWAIYEMKSLPQAPDVQPQAAPPAPKPLPVKAAPTAQAQAASPSSKSSAAKPAHAARSSVSTLTPSNIVRVDLGRLDELMRVLGELVISRAHLEDKLATMDTSIPPTEWRVLQEINQAMERQLRDLRERIMDVRMVPIGEVFARMQFAARDVARADHKQIQLELSGQETELDKYIVERIMDPLLHLVRNAVSHGLESPSERTAHGKPATGHVALRASTAGDAVIIEVEDDGRGIDAKQIAARGRAMGLLNNDIPLDTARLLDILCAPGFSTRDEADLSSGRGVGMTVVKNTVQELGGMLAVDTELGRGTRFTIQLPLTLAIADALIVTVSGQRFAMPLLAVREVIELQPSAVTVFENNEILHYRDSLLPLLHLGQLFQLPANGAATVMVIGSGLSSVGVVVDRVIGQREIVVRSLTDPLVQSPGLAGATELGDGRVVLILDAGALTRLSQNRFADRAKP